MVSYTCGEAMLRVYTRKADDARYPAGLAHSVHFAYSKDGKTFFPLHQDYGILFATSAVREDDTIRPLGLCFPGIFDIPAAPGKRERYGVAAYLKEEGEAMEEISPADRKKIALWTTEDFTQFCEEGVWDKEAFAKEYPYGRPDLWRDTVEIEKSLCDRLMLCWGQLESVEVSVQKEVQLASPKELAKVRATVRYSDGSTDEKRVEWDWDHRESCGRGLFKVRGSVVRESYPYPLAVGFADPVLYQRDGKYYFLSTNDNVDDIGLYLREADDVEGLFEEGCVLHRILDRDEARGFVQTFWAPEFHEIGGELYILFAVSGSAWGPQCHIMRLKKGKPLTDADSWECPVRVVRQDGSMLTEDGITLDMTYVKSGADPYVVWSYRKGIGTKADTGSMLYIARVDEKAPHRLASEPVLLSRPLYGWENVRGTINNEGPHAFVSGGRVYLTYSGGDACGYTYAVGLLSAEEGTDLLKPESWTKSGYPVLKFCSVEGEYGPGHNSFFVSPEGKLMIAYHAVDSYEHRIRCTGMHRIHFDVQGRPVFDMSAQRDLSPALSVVETTVRTM